jgi:hypothetical protein
MNEETKAVVTVSEMARMVGLSRARFYQLQKAGIFPPPERDAETGRPFYSEEQQKVILEVRRRNCGVNQKPILFYARRIPLTPTPPKARKSAAPKPKNGEYADLIAKVNELGEARWTPAQVISAIKEVYPQGIAGVDEAEFIKKVFLHLRGKN